MRIVVAIPCHETEPAVAATVRSLAGSARGLIAAGHDVRIVVCVNGADPARSPAAAALRDLDAGVALSVVELGEPSKPAAWTRLRAEPADITVFADADIEVEPGALPALVAALADPSVRAAAGGQRHVVPRTAAGRVAAVPHRLEWGGLLGTLYAARTDALPAAMPPVLLDDAWLFGHLGGEHVARVPEAAASVVLPATWRDLWRQRVRAEGGKEELRRLGVPLAAPPPEISGWRVLTAYPVREWPYVAALAAVKVAARLWSRRAGDRWRPATSTKGTTPPAGPDPG